MAVMISGNKKDLFATCKCGCQEGVQFHISHEGDEDYYACQCFTNGNFYRDQYGMFGTLKNKLKKIWAIIRNKDYYYSDVLMSYEDFKKFKEYINQF